MAEEPLGDRGPHPPFADAAKDDQEAAAVPAVAVLLLAVPVLAVAGPGFRAKLSGSGSRAARPRYSRIGDLAKSVRTAANGTGSPC